MRGVIIRLKPNKGFGFIRGLNDRMTRFMHASKVEPLIDFERMYEGQRVDFNPVEGGPHGNGLRAENVTIVKDNK